MSILDSALGGRIRDWPSSLLLPGDEVADASRPVASARSSMPVLDCKLDEPLRRGSEDPVAVHECDSARHRRVGFHNDAAKDGSGLGERSRRAVSEAVRRRRR